MIKLYKIDAVHPIAKRVVKSNLTKDQMLRLYQELQTAGYKDENIHRVVSQVIYEDGDEIEIDPSIFDVLPDSVQELETYTQKDVELVNAKAALKYIFGNAPKVIKGKVVAQRMNRSFGHLIIEWKNANEGWEKTNTSIAEALGFKFNEPDFPEIPIDKAPDNMLNEDECVIKYLMIQNSFNEVEARNYLKPIFMAMRSANAVFYQP